MPDQRICVGAISGAFGVRGEIRLVSFTEDPTSIASYGDLEDQGARCRFRLCALRPIKHGFAARIDGVTTREEAEKLRGTQLYVHRSRFLEPEEEEYYYADLIGLPAVDLKERPVGKIRAVHDFGAGDLLEIAPCNSSQTFFVPFTRNAVPRIGADRIVLTDPPETDSGQEMKRTAP